MSDLVGLARSVRQNAYCPYSGYRVGCALRSDSGEVFSGVNVENVSYGATMCAERSAIFAMVGGGDRWIRHIVVATADGGTPCGLCLQVILEFCEKPDELEIVLVDEAGAQRGFTLSQLLPFGFRSSEVSRTEST